MQDKAQSASNTNNDLTAINTIPMSSKVKIYRYLALIGHLSLLVWMSVWYLLLDDSSSYSSAFKIVIYLLPLLLPLYGIMKAKPYTHAWSCFVVLWYFLHAITVMYAVPEYLWHAALELVLACMMFVGCSMFARLRGQELGTGLPKLSKVMEQEKSLFEGLEADGENKQ